MSNTIPLLRAANALPLVRWMEVNRLDTDAYLKAADLGYWYALSPFDPIPTLNGLELLTALARDHGPDVGFQIVDQGSIGELAFIGGVALGSRTPLEAFKRVSFALPMHSTHESMTVVEGKEKIVIEHKFTFPVSHDAQNAMQFLFFSLIQQICRFSGLRPPLFSGLEACPHRTSGFWGFEEKFGAKTIEWKNSTTKIILDGSVARNPFRNVARDRTRTADMSKIKPLNNDGTLAGSVRSVIEPMLYDGNPTIARVARAGGIPVRTLQRRLADEGTSFSDQLDIVRRRVALRYIGNDGGSLEEISEQLGYSAQSSLTRAIRRLTGVTPSQLRNAATR